MSLIISGMSQTAWRYSTRKYSEARSFLVDVTLSTKRGLGCCVYDEGDRAIVDKLNFHHATKLTGLDRDMLRKELDEGEIEWFSLLWFCSLEEIGASPRAAVSIEGELANHQRTILGLNNAFVHLACLIVEDTQAGYLIGEPFSLAFRIGMVDAEKKEKAGAGLAHNLIVDRDCGF